MQKHLSWVKQHSPFYREWTGGVIDKKIMMENFSRLNTVGIDRDEAFKVAFAIYQGCRPDVPEDRATEVVGQLISVAPT